MKKVIFLLTLLPFANVAMAGNYTLEVNGVKCEHCAKHLENELQALDGVNSIDIDVETKLVQVGLANGQELREEQLRKTVEDAGFTLLKVVEPVNPKSAQ